MGEKNSYGLNMIFYLPRERENKKPRRLRVWKFKERAEQMGRRSMVKDVLRFTEELDIELHLEHPWSVKMELQNCQVERLEEEVRS